MRLTFRSLLFAVVVLAMSAASFSQISISVRFGPPAIPVYEQPLCPGEGYIWTPGYWAYDYGDSDYYWVPGTWVTAPEVGFLWTPGYWGWGGDAFLFHEGYWGPRIGFYGGINYGFGYFGNGYEGGRWDGGRFFYNRSVNNINVTNIHNVYNTTVINNNVTRVSYNGGNGGINARPTSEQEAAANERHIPPVIAQVQHAQAARSNPEQRASVNHGSPAVAASARPGEFDGSGVVRAREAGAPYNPPANRGQVEQRGNAPNNVPRPGNPVHASDLSPHERPAPVNTGNPKVDQKYQKQQDKLYAQQQMDHQKLQQKQDQEHQRMAQQNTNDARKQQVEQKHQQQTQQMEQRHQQQQQHLQQKQPAGKNPQKQ
jgi:WXXGXW repeat (2 copies)